MGGALRRQYPLWFSRQWLFPAGGGSVPVGALLVAGRRGAVLSCMAWPYSPHWRVFTRIPFRCASPGLAAVATIASFVWSEIQTTSSPTGRTFRRSPEDGSLGSALSSLHSCRNFGDCRRGPVWRSRTGDSPPSSSVLCGTRRRPISGERGAPSGLGCSSGHRRWRFGWRSGHLLGLRPVRSVGRVSFGWYLLHYPPMILLTGAILPSSLGGGEPDHCCSDSRAGLWHVRHIETPIRRSKTLAYRPWFSIGIGLTLVLAAFLGLPTSCIPAFIPSGSPREILGGRLHRSSTDC